jgi:hypothetical protein
MDKIIIKNKSDLAILEVLQIISTVIKNGRDENNQYCYITIFEINNCSYSVRTDLKNATDIFTIKNY